MLNTFTILAALTWMATAPPNFEAPHPMDMPVPPQPPVTNPVQSSRVVGTGTTLFVNFDGIDLGRCSPSNSKQNCHWYNDTFAFEPYSGSEQMRASIMSAMRSDVEDLGIRITGIRPPATENYTMIIYGGTEDQFGALGSAPSGDCDDQSPNEIGFAHLDGDLASWVNAGATTALHEAAHTWGLDHIDIDRTIMFPSGDNNGAALSDTCERVVGNTLLQPTNASCPNINTMFCDDGNHQHAQSVLRRLFGPAYVDTTPPELRLRFPHHGQYFQTPGSFVLEIDIEDDLHPQFYNAQVWLNNDSPPEPTKLSSLNYRIDGLPVGVWTFHVRVEDDAGNPASLDFTVEVGLDPPPGACACRSDLTRGQTLAAWLGLALVGLVRRRVPA